MAHFVRVGFVVSREPVLDVGSPRWKRDGDTEKRDPDQQESKGGGLYFHGFLRLKHKGHSFGQGWGCILGFLYL